MKYRRLGKTGLSVSVVGIGTWQFGGEWGKAFSQAEADRILGRASELGINLVDTAECYGDHLSEELVGQALRHNRDRWIIATKFGHAYDGHLRRQQLWSPEAVRDQLERSLAALRTDRIDLYQFHSGTDAVFANDALWTMLDQQVAAGKVRFLGISIGSNLDPVHQAESAARVGASALQVVYNRLDRKPEERVFPISMEQDLGVLARVPLASGFLSGKYRPGAAFTAPDDVRSSFSPQRIEEMLREVEEIERSEVPTGVPMAAWALAWCLRHPAVTCVIPGCKSVEQVELNARAAELASSSAPGVTLAKSLPE
jgi:aryl-alcohol dehydrogenase-like predicted oxidoreductase